MQKLLLFNEVIYKHSTKFIFGVPIADTLASEVKCLRVIERRDLSKYLQKQEDILLQENKAKGRARYKADPEKKASVRDSDPEKKKASVRDSYKADPKIRMPLYATATRPIPKRRPLYASFVPRP